MGARPMARLIQDTIRRALADELLFGKLADGGKVTDRRRRRRARSCSTVASDAQSASRFPPPDARNRAT